MDAEELLRKSSEEEVRADPRRFLNNHQELAQALVRALTLFDAARILNALAVEKGDGYFSEVADNIRLIARDILADIGLKEENIEVLLDQVKPLPWEG